jgi:hypothetical protein
MPVMNRFIAEPVNRTSLHEVGQMNPFLIALAVALAFLAAHGGSVSPQDVIPPTGIG